MNRRSLLIQLLGLAGASCGTSVLAAANGPSARLSRTQPRLGAPFPALQGPIPLPTDGLSASQQRQRYAQISLDDALRVPAGYAADVLLSWGDRLGDGHVGYNNDYLAFRALTNDKAVLTINFEYISAKPWCEGYPQVYGRELPWQHLKTELAQRGGRVNLADLASDDPIRPPLMEIAIAAMEDMGIGIAELRRDASGRWRVTPGALDRRVHGLSGWRSERETLQCTGPGAAVFRRRQRQGYDDGLGDRIIGTFANCGGGQTPWGTVLSAEENLQTHVVEAVYSDGSSPDPTQQTFRFDGNRLEGLGAVFGLAGNKYGWMVEIDPTQPGQAPIKHTWLGRFRHEAVAVRARAGEPLVVYSGCDRHGGHIYRYVSRERIVDPNDRSNSRLLENGRLEVAQMNADGSGRWIPLTPETALQPVPPSHYEAYGRPQACLLPHSDRSQPGAQALRSDAELNAYLRQYQRLGDLYPGAGDLQMGAILIDAHLAANAVGATATARPEDTDLDPHTGDLLIAFTAAGADEGGSADPAVFRGPAGEPHWPYGWVMRLQDQAVATQESGGSFSWRMVATGGTPWQGGMGFANPDNLAVDGSGNVWMVTDRSSSSSALDVFGNNACWLIPAAGPGAGKAHLFATGPMECELCGPCFDRDECTLFLAVQHPGEDGGARLRGARELQVHQLADREGQPFEQQRWVPLGSNWPDGGDGGAPKPSVVAIRRLDGRPLLDSHRAPQA